MGERSVPGSYRRTPFMEVDTPARSPSAKMSWRSRRGGLRVFLVEIEVVGNWTRTRTGKKNARGTEKYLRELVDWRSWSMLLSVVHRDALAELFMGAERKEEGCNA